MTRNCYSAEMTYYYPNKEHKISLDQTTSKEHDNYNIIEGMHDTHALDSDDEEARFDSLRGHVSDTI